MHTHNPARSPRSRRGAAVVAGLALIAAGALSGPSAAAPTTTGGNSAAAAAAAAGAAPSARAPKGKKAKQKAKKLKLKKMRKSSKALMKSVKNKNNLNHMKNLATLAQKHGNTRSSGTPGYTASRNYIVRKLKKAGYTPEVQQFDFPFFQVLSPTVVALTAPEERPLVDEVDFLLMTYSGAGDVTAPVEAVDLALDAPADSTSGCEAEDFADFTEGSIALMQRGLCAFGDKAANAEAAGAAGAIIMNQGDSPGERTDLYAGTLGTPGVTIPTVGISFTLGAELAETDGVEMRLAADTQSEIRTTWNVFAETRGAGKNVVMAGAHLDSTPEGPGINDNASGSAALLTVAQKFAKRKHQPTHPKNKMNRVRFAWWGAEEFGLLGAHHYVDDLVANKPAELKRIALYLNFDMVASPNYSFMVYDGDNSAFPPGPNAAEAPKGSAAIEKLFHDSFEAKNIVSAETAFSGRSDYGPFIDQGIAAGGLFTGAEGIKTPLEVRLYGGKAGAAYDSCYHETCDGMKNISRKALRINAKAIAHAVWTYAKNTKTVNGVMIPKKSNARVVQRGAVDSGVTPTAPRPADAGSGPGVHTR